MQKQYNKAYNPIGQSGCYFLSLGAIAEKVTGNLLHPATVNEIYASSVDIDYMSQNCFVKNPDGILLMFLKALDYEDRYDATYIGWWNSDSDAEFWNKWTSDDITEEIIRYKTKWGYHFTTTDYDPYPELTREPDITGRRYFNIKSN